MSTINTREEIYIINNGERYTPFPERAEELIKQAVNYAVRRTHNAGFKTNLAEKVA